MPSHQLGDPEPIPQAAKPQTLAQKGRFHPLANHAGAVSIQLAT